MQIGYELRSGTFSLNEEGKEHSWIKVCDGSGKPYFSEQQDVAEFRIQQWKRPWTPIFHNNSQIKDTSDGIDTILFPRLQDWTRTGKHCRYTAPSPGDIGECLGNKESDCLKFVMFFEAQEACEATSNCEGITMDVHERYHPFTIRTEGSIKESPREEYSWMKDCTTNVE